MTQQADLSAGLAASHNPPKELSAVPLSLVTSATRRPKGSSRPRLAWFYRVQGACPGPGCRGRRPLRIGWPLAPIHIWALHWVDLRQCATTSASGLGAPPKALSSHQLPRTRGFFQPLSCSNAPRFVFSERDFLPFLWPDNPNTYELFKDIDRTGCHPTRRNKR